MNSRRKMILLLSAHTSQNLRAASHCLEKGCPPREIGFESLPKLFQ